MREPGPHHISCGNSRLLAPLISLKHHLRLWATHDWSLNTPIFLFPKANSRKSILDADPEARALLEISGRSRHSEGFRQAPDQE